ncbi:MAG TPA: HD domain-containing phosphohydrolase [Patescibacteria group bacterium]|nr:HD domain-containing phosphohydrolase [Patescibacteria group bacterium]
MLLRVLNVEDSESDSLLILQELKKGQYTVEWHRVDSAEEMLSALQDGIWNLILADYTVPGFGALPALALLSEQNQDVPFIIVSGTIDEDAAVKVMKAGARDYVMKDRLRRLLPAVERELAEADRRRQQRLTEQAAGQTAMTMATLAELLPDLFYVTNHQGYYQLVNSAFERYVQQTREDIIGKTCRDIFPAAVARSIERSDQQVQVDGRVHRQEGRLKVDGEWVYIDNLKVPLRNIDGSVTGIVGLCRDITENKKNELELEARLQQLQRSWQQTVIVLSEAVEARDSYTAGHQRRVSGLAGMIGRRLGMTEDALTGLTMAALLHDIGKLRIPGELLGKPGKLSNLEYQLIQTHVEAGYAILARANFPWNIAEIIYQHQEREDGSGYPRGLCGAEILPEAKIIAVADVVEAISSHRPYRPALGVDAALVEIRANRGRLYDPAVVDACLEVFLDTDFRFWREEC